MVDAPSSKSLLVVRFLMSVSLDSTVTVALPAVPQVPPPGLVWPEACDSTRTVRLASESPPSRLRRLFDGMVTAPRYTPALIEIVSPDAAASTAAWTVRYWPEPSAATVRVAAADAGGARTRTVRPRLATASGAIHRVTRMEVTVGIEPAGGSDRKH